MRWYRRVLDWSNSPHRFKPDPWPTKQFHQMPYWQQAFLVGLVVTAFYVTFT